MIIHRDFIFINNMADEQGQKFNLTLLSMLAKLSFYTLLYVALLVVICKVIHNLV